LAFSDYQLGDTDAIEDFQPEPSLEPTPTAVPAAAAPAAAAAKADDPPKPSQRERDLEKQLKDSNDRAKAAEQSAQFWNQKASATHQAAPKAPEKEEPAVDLLDVLTSGDSKKFAAEIRKMGFASSDEVEKKVSDARNGARIEGRLSAQYPALARNDTPLFKAAARAYGDMVAEDPSLAGKPTTTMLAARMAAAELRADGKDPDAMTDEEVDEVTPARPQARETEAARVRRVAAQGGRRAAAPARGDSADDNELSREQKFIVERFAAAGANLTEESYKARVLKGTRLNGIPSAGIGGKR
jgi:hypothetical protein